ncbi:MAG: TRAP transporter substrate-binding protein [Deltaproteobacteria bacterium]|nr:TRAP transporter substrate-binding protein [Deltaproteobacteria bacterium]MBW2083006.1 TRAP transporter substrate-binding protein [Deltaproteobacteria bacterium]
MYIRSFKNTFLLVGIIIFMLLVTSITYAGPILIKLGWTTSDGPSDPYAITARQFAKALAKEAPGQFKVEFYPNRALGDEKEMLEGLSFGTIHMAVITNAPIASIEPAFQVNDLPFLYPNELKAHKVLDGLVGKMLMKKLEAKNIIGFGFAEGGFREMINNVRPIYTPKDVVGIKWRVMQNPVYIGMFRALGGNAVPMAWGEVFTAVQQGTIDGLEIPIAVIQNNGFYEITKYLSLTNHTYSALGVLMAKRVWNKLSSGQKEAVRKAARIAIVREREMNMANVKRLVDKLQEEGMKINAIKDPNAFREKVKPVYDQFRPSIGSDLLNQVLAEVKK